MASTSTPVSAVADPSMRNARPNAAAAQRRSRREAALAPGFSLTFPKVSWGDIAVPLAVLGVVLAMIAPLPPLALDVLISANITLSVIILLVSMYITRPVEFSVFPTTLLLMTLFRLALNITSSRLILLNGNTGTTAAGQVIEAFGNFVVGGNYIVGTVIFLVLIAIQYVVINHGAVRISEVTARFTLDAMPGKQMSIDSDLNAGLIDEAEARERRRSLAAESEFYGAMDGASRFTQRDAIASIIITAINIVAGFLIGVLQYDMELASALATYTVLTIGDGLVTVIPALMISISGGLIVTRASSRARLSADVRQQVFENVQPLFLASGVLIAMAAFPGLPKIPFLVLGGGLGAFAWRMRQRGEVQRQAAPERKRTAAESLDALLKVEPLAVQVGLGLIKMVEGGADSPLLRRIAGIRRQLAEELGYLLPPVRVTDNLSLKAGGYVILLKGVEVSRFELPPGYEMAIQPGGKELPTIEGTPAVEPAFGMPALWISASATEEARKAGYTVVDPVSILGTHLSETIRRYAHELFSRQDARRLLDRVAEEHPKVVEDLVPKLLPLSVVQKVLQNLLRERVSVRDGVSILEALGDAARELGPDAMLVYSREAPPEARYLGACEVVFALAPNQDANRREEPETASHGHVTPSEPNIARLAEQIAELSRQVSRMSGTLVRSRSVGSAGAWSTPALGEALEALVDTGLSSDLVQDVAARLERAEDLNIGRAENAAILAAARRQLEELLQVDSRIGPEDGGKRIVALVGPPGSGKTTTLVKLAAAYGLCSRIPVQLLSVDTWRIGGAEQLRSYAAILGVGFQALETAGALVQALEEHKQKNLVLIDTPGFSERDTEAASALLDLLPARDDIDVHLTLSATTKPVDLMRAVGRFEGFRPTKLIFTRLDETVSMGTVLTEAVRTAKPISFLTHGQRIPEDLIAATKPKVLDLVFGGSSGQSQPWGDENARSSEPTQSQNPNGSRAAAA